MRPAEVDNRRAWAKVYELMCPACGCELIVIRIVEERLEDCVELAYVQTRTLRCQSLRCNIVYGYERMVFA